MAKQKKTKGEKALFLAAAAFYLNAVKLAKEGAEAEATAFGIAGVLSSKEFSSITTTLQTRFQSIQVSVGDEVARSTIKELGVREVKQRLTAEGRAFLTQNALGRATSVSDTLKDRIRNIAQDIAQRDGTLADFKLALQNSLGKEISEGKLNTIATTEYQTAVGVGQNDALNAVNESLEDNKKIIQTWRTVGDDKVRDSHAQMEGEERELGDEFSNGGLHPCDPSLPPEESINCRCFLEPRIVEQ